MSQQVYAHDLLPVILKLLPSKLKVQHKIPDSPDLSSGSVTAVHPPAWTCRYLPLLRSQGSGHVHKAHVAPVCARRFWTSLDSWAKESLAVFPHRCWVSGGKTSWFQSACRFCRIAQDTTCPQRHRKELSENSQPLVLLISLWFVQLHL